MEGWTQIPALLSLVLSTSTHEDQMDMTISAGPLECGGQSGGCPPFSEGPVVYFLCLGDDSMENHTKFRQIYFCMAR